MAVLTDVVAVTDRLPVGNRFLQTFRTATLGTAAADEWFVTGFNWIESIVGFAVIGTTTSTVALAFTKNAEGTDDDEGDVPGALGIESTDAGINVVEVTILGW